MNIAQREIRRARPGDAAELARLAEELGYPTSAAEMERRLAALLADERHQVLVAASEGRLHGWIDAEHRLSVEGGDRAELVGLVVDATARQQGVGRALVEEAEKWARARGLALVVVRSNAAREASHPFYLSLGYTRSKTQHVYIKTLAGGASGAAS